MIHYIQPIRYYLAYPQWCDHCKKKCDGTDARKPYRLVSTNENVKAIVLCNACMDLALSESNIIPEEF